MLSKREIRPLPRKRSRLDLHSEESHEGESDVKHVKSECVEGIVDIEGTSLSNNNPLVVPPDSTPIPVFD